MSNPVHSEDTKKKSEKSKSRVKSVEKDEQVQAFKPSKSLEVSKKPTVKLCSLPSLNIEKKVIKISKKPPNSQTSGFLPPIFTSEDQADNSSKCSENPAFDDNEQEETDFEYQYFSCYGDEDELTTPLKQAKKYLEQRKIDDFFKFLGAHLTAAQPENPIDFLLNLLQQCIEYRTNFCDPPLLFQIKHIESLYNSLDKMGSGEISLDQYDMGLLMLGLKTKYGDFTPKLNERFMVSKDVFIADAYKLLTKQLNQMICLPIDANVKLPALNNAKTSLTRSG